MADKDWSTSQLVNKLSTEQKFASSEAISLTIPAKSSVSFTITLASAVAGDPVSVSPDTPLGDTVSAFYRAVEGGVQVRLFNSSTVSPATISAAVFKAVIFKEVS